MAALIDYGQVVQILAAQFHDYAITGISKSGFLEPEPEGYTAIIRVGAMSAASDARISSSDTDHAEVDLELHCEVSPEKSASKPAAIATVASYAALIFNGFGPAAVNGCKVAWRRCSIEIQPDGQIGVATVTHRFHVMRSGAATIEDFLT